MTNSASMPVAANADLPGRTCGQALTSADGDTVYPGRPVLPDPWPLVPAICMKSKGRRRGAPLLSRAAHNCMFPSTPPSTSMWPRSERHDRSVPAAVKLLDTLPIRRPPLIGCPAEPHSCALQEPCGGTYAPPKCVDVAHPGNRFPINRSGRGSETVKRTLSLLVGGALAISAGMAAQAAPARVERAPVAAQGAGITAEQRVMLAEKLALVSRIMAGAGASQPGTQVTAEQQRWMQESLYKLPVAKLRTMGAPSGYDAAASAISPRQGRHGTRGPRPSSGRPTPSSSTTRSRPAASSTPATSAARSRTTGRAPTTSMRTGDVYGGSAPATRRPTVGNDSNNIGAISMNVAIVDPSSFPGFLGARPVGSTNTTSLVNWYQAGPSVQASNAGIITTDQSLATRRDRVLRHDDARGRRRPRTLRRADVDAARLRDRHADPDGGQHDDPRLQPAGLGLPDRLRHGVQLLQRDRRHRRRTPGRRRRTDGERRTLHRPLRRCDARRRSSTCRGAAASPAADRSRGPAPRRAATQARSAHRGAPFLSRGSVS